jgi:hypothetical protein
MYTSVTHNILVVNRLSTHQPFFHHELQCYPFPDIATMSVIQHCGNNDKKASDEAAYDTTCNCSCVAF